jgi:hypothetical protein
MSITFYSSHDLTITDEVFEVRRPTPFTVDIADLQSVHVIQGEPHEARRIFAYLAGASLITATISWWFMHSMLAHTVTLILASAVVAAVAICWRVTPPASALRATVGAYDVTLFESADETTFGQVRRALGRALESHGRTRRQWSAVDTYR